MKRFLKMMKRVGIAILIVVLFIGFASVGINLYVRLSVKNRIITPERAAKLEDVDCIIVLGASVKANSTPSLMLKDRLDRAIELFGNGCSNVIIMSGDHGSVYYDEVGVMKNYAIEKGVSSEKIFKDHAGFSTYDTMYRAKEIFGAKKVVIVTQDYHLYRSLYIAKSLGLDAYGVAAKDIRYNGQIKRDVREYCAVVKDFFMVITKPEASVMGAKISLQDSGNVTD